MSRIKMKALGQTDFYGNRGSTLLVSIMLLLLLSVVTFFGVSVGLREQKTSGNDLRAKLVNQVADAALNHANEFLKLRASQYLPEAGENVDNAFWELCQANDNTFPCGVVPETAAIDLNGDGAVNGGEATVTFRARHYRFIGGIDLDGDGTRTTMERRSLPFSTPPGGGSRFMVASIGNFTGVEYNVGSLLCRLDKTAPANAPARCTLQEDDTTDLVATTLVAKSMIDSENAGATIAKTLLVSKAISIPANAPPIVASGGVAGIGSSTIVTSPNSGGINVPVSVWTRGNFDSDNGTWQTCEKGEWINNAKVAPGQIDIEVVDGIVVCDSGCDCPSNGKLSERDGDPFVAEGIDILDVDGNQGANKDSPSFPCDVVQYALGAQTREDLSAPADGICESQIYSGGDPSKPDVEEFLEENFEKIADCSSLGAASAGAFWATGGCDIRSQVGSPAAPVIIVADNDFKANASARIFGMIVVRDTTRVLPGTGVAAWNPGGGGAQIYGAVIVEGTVDFNGGATIIGDPDVLSRGTNQLQRKSSEVPGNWSDRYSF